MSEPSFNKYKGSSEIPYNIIRLLFYNENIWKLLYYTTPDALDQPALTAEQKSALVWRGQEHQENYRVFLTPMQEDTVYKQSTILKLYRSKIKPTGAFYGNMLYAIEIECNTKLGMLSDGRPRLDVLWEEISQMLIGANVGGIGTLFFNQASGGDSSCLSSVSFENTRNYMGYGTIFGVRYGRIEDNRC